MLLAAVTLAVGVRVNGALVATIGTYSATTHQRVLRALPGFGHRRGAITLELMQRSRNLVVDGLAVTRA